MKNTTKFNIDAYILVSALFMLIGSLLLIFMISTEGEPGALPLLLLLLGSAGLLFRCVQFRKFSKSNNQS